jgi:hypothetical protein
MSTFDQWTAAMKATVQILKKRFNSLTAEEALELSAEIVKAVIAAHEKEEE